MSQSRLEVHDVGLAGGLSRSQVADLVHHGWEVDAHTFTHPDLTTLGPSALRHEVAVILALDEEEVQAVDAELAGAPPSTPSLDDEPYQLPPLRVLPYMTPAQVLGLVRGQAPR